MRQPRLAGAALVTLLALAGSTGAAGGRLVVPDGLKVVSYYRADAGWTSFWTDWQPDRIADDLDRVASLNANTVRAIVQPAAFGYPHPDPTYVARLEEFVSLASQRGLHVQLTLFDQWFEWADLRGSRAWAGQLLVPYVEDPRIAFVELRNELLPKPETTAWARAMVRFVRSVLQGKTPVTISVAGVDPVARLRALKRAGVRPDFYDIHLFGGGGELARSMFARAKAVAAPTPLWIGETGYPTTSAVSGYGGVPRTASAQEEAQSHFFASTAWAARAEGLPPVRVWVLSDFLPSAVPEPPVSEADPELHYGLFRIDGSGKPAVRIVRAMYAGRAPVDFNGGFEREVVDASGAPVPAEWSMNGAGASFVEDRVVSRTRRRSVRVTSPGVASLSITPPNAGFRGGGRVAVSAWARRAGEDGRVFVVVEWFGARNERLGKRASPPLRGRPLEWRRLSVSSRAPHGAAYASIELVAERAGAPVWFDDVSFVRRGP